MLKVLACCDMCGKVLPVKTVHTPLGSLETIDSTKTKVWDTQTVLPYLCKECALTIDNSLLSIKLEMLKTVEKE